MLGSATFGDTTVVIADLEAGIGTLTRLHEQTVDAVIVVVEPTPRSIDVGQRAADLARDRRQGQVVVFANRVVDDADEARVRLAFPGHELVVAPYDEDVADADRAGVSVLDTAPDSPLVAAVASLVRLLALAS